ncbi:MAG: hypothetical protein RDU76_06330 [Candidatus Edwardsbacteria bacterium]|nr:hypothetical protein [Candidatus Edwardsbacteria bacterium]
MMKKNNVFVTPRRSPAGLAEGWGLIIFTAVLMALSGCGRPVAPSHSNPYDPDNPDFTGPAVEIISPAEGASIASGTATIRLHGSGVNYEYSYRLDTAQAWHEPWSKDTILTITNLKEGAHTIQAIARDRGGYLGLPTPPRSFIINQYANTFIMYPPSQTIAVGETAQVWCEMEDMATPVAAVRLIIYMNNPYVIDTVGAGADTGYHWVSNGGSPLGPFFSDYGSDYYMDVSLGVAGGSPAGVTGTGRIFKIKAVGMAAATSMYLYVNTIEARDTLNNPITTTNPYKYAYIYIASGKEGGK